MKFKIGKGQGNSFKMGLGMSSVFIRDNWKHKTLAEIAKILAKKTKIKNGELNFESIDFSFCIRNEED